MQENWVSDSCCNQTGGWIRAERDVQFDIVATDEENIPPGRVKQTVKKRKQRE